MRFPEMQVEQYSADQLAVYREVCDGPRGGFRGPLHVLIRAPELARQASRMGEYLRYNSSLAPRISEFTILIAARVWTSQFEWYVHAQHAAKAGLSAAIMAALAAGRRPAGMAEDEAATHDFCMELHRDKAVGDATFERARRILGEVGVVDLTGLCGYYTLVSMALNLNRTPLPPGVPDPLQPLASATGEKA